MIKIDKKRSDNAILWLEALLSGKYKQGKTQLGNAEIGFCCWGVACHVLKVRYCASNSWEIKIHDKIGFPMINGHEEGQLPKGLSLYGEKSLMAINDETNAGFKRIAKFLIKHADECFKPTVAASIKLHKWN